MPRGIPRGGTVARNRSSRAEKPGGSSGGSGGETGSGSTTTATATGGTSARGGSRQQAAMIGSAIQIGPSGRNPETFAWDGNPETQATFEAQLQTALREALAIHYGCVTYTNAVSGQTSTANATATTPLRSMSAGG